MKPLAAKIQNKFYKFLDRSPTIARWYLSHIWSRYGGKRPYVQWGSIIARTPGFWYSSRDLAQRGPAVLLGTVVGGHQVGTIVESALAAALTLRGVNVHVFLCDTALPACFRCTTAWYSGVKQFVRSGPGGYMCRTCYAPGVGTFEPLGVHVHRYSDYLSDSDREQAAAFANNIPLAEISSCRFGGLAVGEHALAGTLRFFGRASIDQEPHAEPVLRRYVHAAALTVLATRRLLSTVKFRSAVFHHGLYVPHGLLGEVCREAEVPVVNWGATYRQQCFIFSHGDTYHHTMMQEPTEEWEQMPWTSAMEERILDYLKSRWHGTRDWIRVHDDPETDLEAINRELKLDPSKPCVGLLTNVMWDAQVCYPTNAFKDMREWVFSTIKYFAERPELQLLIRVHPAEAHRGPVQVRQLILKEIQEHYPVLPPNIFIVPAESKVSTYALMGQCNAVLIYATKAGVELAATGMHVVVAGEAWVRNKGITHDVSSPEEYFRMLDRLPFSEPLGQEATERALRYAYHFFFRRMIPLEMISRPDPNAGLTVSAEWLHQLLPGQNVGLDVICNGILHQTPFVFPIEAIEDSTVQRSLENDLVH